MISQATADHYRWGVNCDGWRLVNQPGLSVIQEQMPPGTKEVRHFHQQAWQFFFVLSGVVTLEVDGRRETIGERQGLEIAPGTLHQIFNESDSAVEFLVISQPTTVGDRVILEKTLGA